MKSIQDHIYEFARETLYQQAQRLEQDCTTAIALQRYDMLDRLEIVQVEQSELNVASVVFPELRRL